ncbi:hypothetical protein C9374_010038 [Naegleria lovaniensis]|uniref:EGF-like domain-containing protein n=1 Tax=Naegleria lovaniensis TaxID=51637 RepID=A0AA88KG50_NAELO|nr:uncharacterized protein C9374_010038 [Naegleria lovaniensis]KAG2375034.1 hypothetical protein C9374_010038 [Naegleria lovaniensis]
MASFKPFLNVAVSLLVILSMTLLLISCVSSVNLKMCPNNHGAKCELQTQQQTTISHTQQSCGHGTYDPRTRRCKCASGWKGSQCNIPIHKPCPKKCSATHASCVNGKCQCKPGYHGPQCTCHAPTTCNNRGSCTSSGKCQCKSGWTGSDCKTPKVVPSPKPSLTNSTF